MQLRICTTTVLYDKILRLRLSSLGQVRGGMPDDVCFGCIYTTRFVFRNALLSLRKTCILLG